MKQYGWGETALVDREIEANASGPHPAVPSVRSAPHLGAAVST